MSVAFNTIPGSGLTAPFFGFEVNSGGQYDPSSRAVLIGHKTAAGTMAENTPILCTTLAEADALAGPGSMLREMFRAFNAMAPTQETWIMAVAAAGVAPTFTMTLASMPAAGGVGFVDIMGERIQVTINPGDTPTIVATALAAAINAYFNELTGAMLPVTAASAAAVVTLTSRHAGAIMAEIDVYNPVEVASNAFAVSGRLTIANGTAASGTPTLTTALAALADDNFDTIVSPFSDATNLTAYASLLNDANGRWSWLRQSYGHVWTGQTGSTSALTTLGQGLNDRHLTIIGRITGSPHPVWLWVADRVGIEVGWLHDAVTGNVSRNQSGRVGNIRPPRDRTTWPIYNARNSLNRNGISTWVVSNDGRVAVDKSVTTYRLNTSAQPDAVFRDVQRLYQLMHALRYFRSALAFDHGNKSLADSNPAGLQAMTTVRDIKATLIGAYGDLVARGILEDQLGFAQRVVVERDTVNTNRVNALLPIDAVNALDIFAANATIYSQYRAA